ncbi:Lrp/AsnC family transcriptional regulator [Halovivax gelatinilyticus]|uniref:Lrp/AsnC family transcriptional regulator n=1 Tax=Halovivax gelatinilyticus TaxID=2961597 RepID=UPI0020CA56DF|nr:winged helix-turn-helix transcriptional regulator [Halovivax gelatinilyticus]
MVSDSGSADEYRLDEIDRRILYALMDDARTTSAPEIAEHVNVSPATIRNRIARLEDHGIITGYHAEVNFERADGRLTNLFLCNVPFPDIERITAQAGTIPGIVNVRELMGGRTNMHVLAVGEDTTELRRIGRQLSNLGLEIEDEMLVQDEKHHPYAPFGPDNGQDVRLADSISLSGGAEVVDITVEEEAPIVGRTIQEAVEARLLDDDTLLIAIERGDETMTPHGDTVIQSNDIVTLFSPHGEKQPTIDPFKKTDDSDSTVPA